MKVVILAGGYGTRLSEETATIPKPMIEIGGRPLLWHLMKLFSTQGFNEFIVALGYKGHIIKKYFLDYPRLQSDLHIEIASGTVLADRKSHEDWMIDLVDTGTTSMTGGRLRRLSHLLDDTFIFTYGDGLSNIRIDELVRFHRDHGKLATVTAVRPPPRFGVLRLAGDRVTTFNEKTDYPGTLINGGYFVLEPGVIDFIEDDQTIWERGPCERLANEGQLMAYPHHDYWQCVDTLHELRMLRETWDSGNAPWKVWK